ncbi:odontogenesis associated phosphoprotein [Myotis myotis]|uniref:Odontogenesis associated phosphoprotein n=1 Tax=Myotis myotis TaxID=51298 RepID=A0A7J8AP47_MYOMY|nr:odontogenesis associated phosphoprotein [Myotis myotis]KAF6388158.1 odontogenesis associated phosphoprotein [Myotis myotis]
MAHRLCLPCWLLVCWLVVTVAEGQVVTPPGGSQNNEDPTDCQIFTLTPPPATRRPVTRIQPITRTPKCPFHFFPTRRPRVQIRLPNRPFLPPRCNHRFQYRPFFLPNNRLSPHYNYFPRRRLQRGSSSEERRGKREAPNLLSQRRSIPQIRL